MLEMFSPAFADGGPIPRAHTCDGADMSPPLVWSGVPDTTQSLALIVEDPDAPAGNWVHWVVYNMPHGLGGLPSGVPTDPEPGRPAGARQGVNDFRRIGYGGPCPPKGPAHRYVFTLYAVESVVSLPPGSTKALLIESLKGHVLAQASFTGTYARA